MIKCDNCCYNSDQIFLYSCIFQMNVIVSRCILDGWGRNLLRVLLRRYRQNLSVNTTTLGGNRKSPTTCLLARKIDYKLLQGKDHTTYRKYRFDMFGKILINLSHPANNILSIQSSFNCACIC